MSAATTPWATHFHKPILCLKTGVVATVGHWSSLGKANCTIQVDIEAGPPKIAWRHHKQDLHRFCRDTSASKALLSLPSWIAMCTKAALEGTLHYSQDPQSQSLDLSKGNTTSLGAAF